MAICRRVSFSSSSVARCVFFAVCVLSYHALPVSATPLGSTRNQNVTIHVPPGSRYLSGEDIICTPSTWTSTLTFFLANYISHAATVKPMPGQTILAGFLAGILALILPTAGTLAGVDTIFRHAIFCKEPLVRVSQAGALCVVVRTSSWRPEDGDIVKGVRCTSAFPRPAQCDDPSNNRKTMQQNGTASSRTRDEASSIRLDEEQKSKLTYGVETFLPGRVALFLPTTKEWSTTNRKVHGLCYLPKGYALALLPKGIRIEPPPEPEIYQVASSNTEKPQRPKFWSRETWHAGNIFEKFRLYIEEKEHADTHQSAEISSSYSLSKGLIALFQTIYASITLFRARGDQINRYGYAAFGLTVAPYAIMSFVNLVGNLLTPDYPAVFLVRNHVMNEAARRQGGRFDGVVGQIDEFEDDGTHEIVFRVDSNENTSVCRPADHLEYERCCQEVDHQLYNPREAMDRPDSIPAFIVPGRPAVGDYLSQRRQIERWFVVACSLLVSLFAFVIVGALSRFARGSSTWAQRSWTLAWLIVGTGIGLFFQLVTIAWGLEDDWARSSGTTLFMVILVYGAPAVGGLVVVAQMLQSYGNCTRLY